MQFTQIPELHFLTSVKSGTSYWTLVNQYVISVPERRYEFRAFLNDNGIGNEVYYPVPFHEQECFQYLGYRSGDFPNSEHAAKHTVALPIYPELTNEQQDSIITKIGEYYG
ncbi:hypothetical protein GF373_05705 [bacterium]|nr:hypothetical protein [bacterium]